MRHEANVLDNIADLTPQFDGIDFVNVLAVKQDLAAAGGSSMRLIMRIVVVFPEPDVPIRQTNSPL